MAMSTYSCFCFTRKFKIAEVQPPDDVRMVFEAYADGVGNGGGPTISAEGLRRFLVESQGEKGVSSAEVTRIMEKFRGVDAATTGPKHYLEKMVKHVAPNFLSIEEFYHFLFSIDFNPPIKHEVHQDMTLPISHYYVFTGHNSYLTGNQLSSDCSDAPIIKALQKGVRVIELDMWPNSTKDNVDILHGRTLTSPVEMIKCLRSIKEYAFCTTPYPLVITLEDHLTPDLQAKVAEMIRDTFGDMLYIPSDEPMKEFPSPEDLKNRIIVSTKPPKEYLESKDNKSSGSQKGSSGNVITERYSDVLAEEACGKDMSDSKSEASYDKDEEESDEEEEEYPKFGKDTANQYRKLIAIQAGKCKGSIKDALQIDPARVRRVSFGEQKLIKACTSHSADVIRFTQRNLLRVYPKGTRVRSTNYKPMLAWTHGAQMVAFNTQGHGKQLRIMQGFFKANGSCGYVKKPDFLMNVGPNGEVFDPSVPLPVKQTLKVKVYMGDGWRMDFSKTHFDTYSPPDFYTKIAIEGVPADILRKKTKVIEDNWVPVWDEEFSFPLRVPELAILRIEVKDYNMSEKHDFGGQTCLPVSELRPGIRAVPLYDKKGSVYKSVRLLVRFKLV